MKWEHSSHLNTVFESENHLQLTFFYPCESPFKCSPYKITLDKGSYFLEVYGAQGGNATYFGRQINGGKGGYSSGIYTVLSKSEVIFLYIGATSNSVLNQFQHDVYNGGGRGNTGNDGPGGVQQISELLKVMI